VVKPGHLVPGGYKYGDLALQVGEVSNLREQNMVMDPAGFGPENDGAGEDQQQLETAHPSPRQRGCYIRTITASVQLENTITGRESQGACRQEEEFGGKPPVVM
jgi:hypothetical protein